MMGWDFGLKAPLQITRGFVGTSLAGGKTNGGTVQIERLTPDPLDTACDTKATVRWGEESTWLGMGTPWTTRELEVQDVDATKDLRATLGRTEQGRAELVITNGQGPRSTEMRFPLGQADSVQDGVELRGETLKVTHRERKAEQETRISMGGQDYVLRDGRLQSA